MSESTAIESKKCIILNYVRGRRTQKNKQILIKIQGIDSDKAAAKFIGRSVIWQTASGKKIKIHGKNGVVKARFENGLPGQAIGTEIKLA